MLLWSGIGKFALCKLLKWVLIRRILSTTNCVLYTSVDYTYYKNILAEMGDLKINKFARLSYRVITYKIFAIGYLRDFLVCFIGVLRLLRLVIHNLRSFALKYYRYCYCKLYINSSCILNLKCSYLIQNKIEIFTDIALVCFHM